MDSGKYSGQCCISGTVGSHWRASYTMSSAYWLHKRKTAKLLEKLPTGKSLQICFSQLIFRDWAIINKCKKASMLTYLAYSENWTLLIWKKKVIFCTKNIVELGKDAGRSYVKSLTLETCIKSSPSVVFMITLYNF